MVSSHRKRKIKKFLDSLKQTKKRCGIIHRMKKIALLVVALSSVAALAGRVPVAAIKIGELSCVTLTNRWQKPTADISIATIPPFEKGYVYTNKTTGLVHQLNYSYTYPANTSSNAVFAQMREVENLLAKAFPGAEAFRDRKGRPEHIYGRSAYLSMEEGWIVAINVEPMFTKGYEPTYRAILAFWNPRVARDE